MVLETQRTDKDERLKRINQVYYSVNLRLAAEFVLLVASVLIYFYFNGQCWFGLLPPSSIKIISLYEEKDGKQYPLEEPGLRWDLVTKDRKPQFGVTLRLKKGCYCSDSNIYVQLRNETGHERINISSGTFESVARNGNEITWEGDWAKPVAPGDYKVHVEFLCLDSKEKSRTHFFSFILAEIPVK